MDFSISLHPGPTLQPVVVATGKLIYLLRTGLEKGVFPVHLPVFLSFLFLTLYFLPRPSQSFFFFLHHSWHWISLFVTGSICCSVCLSVSSYLSLHLVSLSLMCSSLPASVSVSLFSISLFLVFSSQSASRNSLFLFCFCFLSCAYSFSWCCPCYVMRSMSMFILFF